MADAVAQEYQEYPANALLVPHLVCFWTQTIADGAPRPHPVCPMPALTSSSSGRSVRPSAHEMLNVDVPLRETDPAQWSSYGLLPLQVAPTPTARYFPDFEAAIAANLDRLLERQGEDGSWEPTWSWGRFDDVWEQARVEWKAVLTLENLRILRAYGRISA